MNGHRSSSNNPDNLPHLVTIHTKSHQLHFNPCCIVWVLHKLPPNTNHFTSCHIELAFQIILPSRHSPGINFRQFPIFFPSSFPVLQPWWHFSKPLMWRHHYRVFTYIYSLLIEKGMCDRQNISSFHTVVLTFIQISLHFSLFSLSFLNYFVFHTSVPPFPCGL